MRSRPARPTLFLIVLLSGSGVLHLLRPRPFAAIVPKMLPHPTGLVYLSGAAEIAGAALMAIPRTRRAGGVFSAALLAGVFPANVSMALQSGGRPTAYRVITWLRLPLQIPLVRWAWRADR